ncbi:cysteine desulfurase family protein [uncultured Litoreibacter sp.]|uniref:cysteine desulfurase family protein n=1 Tax=uncultured Litoreibacter sp. TaxID=1392394 RepID=UPI00262817B5|nr:cysteine desulfurase family protein [uncultured Litoreibacter sp.]
MAEPIYLDHNASTPIDPRVLDTVIRVSRETYANPSSIEHGPGAAANGVVQQARTQVAELIKCRENEILFTSGSTEANNLAIVGSYRDLRDVGRTHFITSVVEHPSVLACFDWLESQGARVTRLGVDQSGQISLDELSSELSDQTGLVSIMAANNETGVLQPFEEAARLCEDIGALFHTDFSQATAYIPLNLRASAIHMASFSGHKAYGPKGVGALYRSIRKPRVKLTPVLLGGGQEAGLRSGTLNTPGIAGLGHACSIIADEQVSDSQRTSALRDQLEAELEARIPLVVNGDKSERLPNSLSVTFDGIAPQALMQKLRSELCFSASSACATEHVETSHVLLAMFGETARARNAFRLGLGRQTTRDEIEKAATYLAYAANLLGQLTSKV